jgi:hypothetical protein
LYYRPGGFVNAFLASAPDKINKSTGAVQTAHPDRRDDPAEFLRRVI